MSELAFVALLGACVLGAVAVSLYGRERPASPAEPRDEGEP
jgi:hypothetical protein